MSLTAPTPESILKEAQRCFHVGDPLADEALRVLAGRGVRPAKLAAQATALAQQGEPACGALLDHMHARPPWIDEEQLAVGARLAQRNAPQLMLALTYGALPLAFSHPSSAAVFNASGDFARSVGQRLRLSAPLFFGVAERGALEPTGQAFMECLHVRLVHAHVRALLLARPSWNRTAHGTPLSRLQLATGPAFFGTQVVVAMRRLGARIDAEQEAAHSMVYRLVTYLLGGSELLLGASYGEQQAIDAVLLPLAITPDAAGRALTLQLLDGLSQASPTRHFSPQQQRALMRTCLGDAWADALGVPPVRAGKLGPVAHLLAAHGAMAAEGSPLSHPLQRLGLWLLRSQVEKSR